MPADPMPTERARELVRGGFDTHIHVEPDVIPRRVDDVTLAGLFAARGLAGFLLKSHYAPTAERAQVVGAVAPEGVRCLGSIALNASVGGLNPLAVEIAGREGARTVWLPTVDAANETAGRIDPPPRANLPAWAQLQQDLRARGMLAPPVEVVDEDGEVLPGLQQVLEVVADHGMLLATGHLSRDEIFAVVGAAVDAGVETVVVTNPEFPSHTLSPDDQQRLASRGALLQRALTTPYTGKCTWEDIFTATRAVGARATVWGSDLGQRFNPPVEDGLAIMADRFLEAGFSEEEVRIMAVENTRRLAGA